MEQQRRMILFVTLSMALLIGYQLFVLPVFFPLPPRPPAQTQNDSIDDLPVSALFPENRPAVEAIAANATDLPQHEPQTVTLGSLVPDSGYFAAVELTSLGGAVEYIRLNDPRYPEFGKRGTPLRLVGHDPLLTQKTFATISAAFDQQLGRESLESIHWEVVPDSVTQSTAAFRLTSLDGRLRITKRYEFPQLPAGKTPDTNTRDTWSDGYQLKLTISIENLSAAPMEFDYTLRGPTGLPLEDAPNTYKFRDVRMGFLRENGGVDSSLQNAAAVVQQKKSPKGIETWTRPIKYLGIDTQYFAVLVQPVEDQLKARTIDTTQAFVADEARKPEHSDLGVTLTSIKRTIAPNATQSDSYHLYAGPKRQALLEPLGAAEVLDYGWFSSIVVLMLWILNSLHAAGLNYGLAIIGLTCIVRGLMFPLSRHQLHNMEKVKELQPRMAEVQAKLQKDPSSLTPQETALLKEVQFKTLGGCLPVMLQLPIFFALYRALGISVDLRMAPLHIIGPWIDNLASPDAFMQLGFQVPWLAWTELNLLPILTAGLFLVQQKLTMPPPVNEEQAMQYKMMNIMVGVMGVMLYRVPAGLCIYMIASSLWGLAERWVLKRWSPPSTTVATAGGSTPIAPVTSTARPVPAPDKPQSSIGELWGKLQEMADKQSSSTRPTPSAGKGGRKPKSKR